MKAAWNTVVAILCCWMLAGCAPVIVGAAGGTYKVATDERTMGDVIDDTTLTVKVNGMLLEDKTLPVRKIDVDVLQGHVTLTGVVDTREQAARAVEIARRVDGVKGVTNNLQIGIKTLGQSFNDKVTGTRIKAKLMREPDIRSLNIDVDVNRGVVTLTGIVGSEKIRSRALEIARTTPGAVKVVDNLTVENPVRR